MVDVSGLVEKNAKRWATAKLTRGGEFVPVAKRLVGQKGRYQVIQTRTGVPWFVIAVIHQRESSQNFSKSIAQGDPWNQISTHVPKGRGPFKSFEDAAADALVGCPPYAARWKDWSAGGTMTLLEQYNGLGYFRKGLPSPYIWSGTDQYKAGKYVADGVFDAGAVDKQLGCAGLIMAMRQLDPTIKFTGEIPAPPDVPSIPVEQDKSGTKAAAQSTSIIAAIAAGVSSGSIKLGLLFLAIGIFIAIAIHLICKRNSK